MRSKIHIVVTGTAILGAVMAAGLALQTATAAPASPPSTPMTPATRGTITIKRSFTRPCYNAIPLTIFVDGKPVSKIGGGQSVKLRALAGRYTIAIAMGNESHAHHKVNVDITPREHVILHAALTAGGNALRRVD